jgi:two-component system phosphate regulon sensor histidine kinase PhoR
VKGITLRNTMENEVYIRADRGRMAQVFSNLFTNAINYGVQGGWCEVRAFDMGDHVLLEVADNGIGIAAEHLPRLFERFYRVGKSRARNEGGSGLGLAIVKHIIEAHDGTIAVKSKEGEGAVFRITLPRAGRNG